MEYRLDNRVVLTSEKKNQSLYSWSIKEFDKSGRQIGGDNIPWDWSLRFQVVELIPTCHIQIKRNVEDDKAKASETELSDYLYGKLRPSEEARQAGLYSMFGTQREVSDFSVFVYRATDGQDQCRLWGSVSYTSEWDFQQVTERDTVQVYIYLSAAKFDHLMAFVKFPRPTSAEIRLRGVSGFYAEWSPSIRTDRVKILADSKDQRLENPAELSIVPPILGDVKEFDFTLQQKYPLLPKGS